MKFADFQWATVLFLALVPILMGSGCASTPKVPLQAPPAVKVLVPVPVPCVIAEVPKSALPSQSNPILNDIYRAVQIVLADRAVLKADRERMAAANSDPCPQEKSQ